MDRVGISYSFEKAAPDGSYVRGWASVISVNGEPVIDHSGDVVTMKALREAAHNFIHDQRIAKVMHGKDSDYTDQQIGEVCEAVMIDDDFCKAIGADTPNRGLWIGMKITDPITRANIRKGKLPMFSVGGRGSVVELKEGEDVSQHLDA